MENELGIIKSIKQGSLKPREERKEEVKAIEEESEDASQVPATDETQTEENPDETRTDEGNVTLFMELMNKNKR